MLGEARDSKDLKMMRNLVVLRMTTSNFDFKRNRRKAHNQFNKIQGLILFGSTDSSDPQINRVDTSYDWDASSQCLIDERDP